LVHDDTNMRIASFIFILLSPLALFSQKIPDQWLTYYEKSGCTKTPRYAETMEFCRRLESASPWISVRSFGKSPQGRDLIMVVASKEKINQPSDARASGKAILLIQNGIHAGEIDGKDACLMLLRDIAITKRKAALLDNVILLVIPIYNVDGHEKFGPYNRINQNGPEEMGWRVTAQGLNLNRDYMKADAPETQAWLRMFNEWLPDFFIDVHVTDGADYQYVITYGVEKHQNIAEPVRSWVRDRYVPMISSIRTNGIHIAPYVSLLNPENPSSGMGSGVAPPRLSTPYVALQNRPALLIETHMLKNYKARVEGTYHVLVSNMEFLNQEYRILRDAVNKADLNTIEGIRDPLPVRFETAHVPNTTFHYLGYKQVNTPSEISGGTWIQYSADPFDIDVPFYDSVLVTKTIDVPKGYLIPPQWEEVIQRLQWHGVKMEKLEKSLTLDVEMYRLTNPKWQQSSNEGRHPVTFTTERFREKREFPAGTLLVKLNQRTARVAVNALEPEAPDAFVTWGFFDALFEQKEYAENYVMERMAKEMLTTNTAISDEYWSRVSSDSLFAKNPSARLNFFYQHSPYRDNEMGLYPVARLMQDFQEK
jgi:Zinc carboxypeptidase